ncbi:MAG: preprotein translocase subunit SecE [Bdellovibrionales bacterium]|nr:preprotein translocase subunit SecE [Bdellovibrionales bacterium]
MESQYQKWVNLAYAAVCALFAYVILAGGTRLAAAYDLETKVRNIDLIIRVGSIGLAAVLFFALFKNRQANGFMNEVVDELAKVTWPTQKETTSATVIVIIMVLISGVVLGLLDYVWTRLVQLVI